MDNIILNIQHLDVWFLQTFIGKNYFQILYILLFDLWLWIPLVYLFFKYILLQLWIDTRNDKFKRTLNFILLAIDVPKKNEQSIAAMELVFTQILGAHKTQNFVEKWWNGEFQPSFSCEIVSIEGYIQLLIRTPDIFRELIEGSIYGQFPDAEITQVEDYVNTVPSDYPNPTHDMWGVEWSMDNKKNPFMPIKTYTEFQDSFSQIFTDPLAGLLEAMGKIGEGEQIWMHILCTPKGVDWTEGSDILINDILGRPNPVHVSILDNITEMPVKVINEISEQLLEVRPFPETSHESKEEDGFGKMWKMSPGERTELEAMQKKIGKLAYGVKLRYGYFYEHGKGSKGRGLNPIIGSIKQFNAIGRNGFRPEIKRMGTKAEYFMVDKRKAYRQRKITAMLKGRATTAGMPKMLLNTEELATLFHFPSMEIKAPMLKKTDMVKSEGPINLPFENNFNEPDLEAPVVETQTDFTNISEQYTPHFDYDNDEFEKRFAIDKKAFEESRLAREERLKEITKEEVAQAEISAHIKLPEKEILDESQFKFAQETDTVVAKPILKDEDYRVEVVDSFAGKKAHGSTKKEEENLPSNLPFI